MSFLKLAWPGIDVPSPGGVQFKVPRAGEVLCNPPGIIMGHITQAAQWTACPDEGGEAVERKGVGGRNSDRRKATESKF